MLSIMPVPKVTRCLSMRSLTVAVSATFDLPLVRLGLPALLTQDGAQGTAAVLADATHHSCEI